MFDFNATIDFNDYLNTRVVHSKPKKSLARRCALAVMLIASSISCGLAVEQPVLNPTTDDVVVRDGVEIAPLVSQQETCSVAHVMVPTTIVVKKTAIAKDDPRTPAPKAPACKIGEVDPYFAGVLCRNPVAKPKAKLSFNLPSKRASL